VPSADLRIPGVRALAVGGAALLATALGGCVSTQTKNTRTLLVNARTLDSQSRVRVTTQNPDVTVSGVQLISSRSGIAVAVTLTNTQRHPVSDLPISVGLRSHGHTPTYLNGAANLPYFATHIAGIAAASSTVWVFTARHVSRTAGAKLFAVVGEAGTPASTRAGSLPRLNVATAPAGSPSGGLGVSVVNASGVPQYGLPVYAVATRNGRAVGAASGSISQLDGGSRTRLRLRLFGTTTGATVQLSAPPTIFN
jgi:hypothetical protein